jgi:glycosyltransferase involved in cell wall biosynthesis
MKVYYVANARMPNDKGHGLQIALMCEAFVEAGAEVTLVVPARGSNLQDIQQFYSLRVSIPIVRLAVPDVYTFGRVGFFISSVFFILHYAVFLLSKRLRGERFIVYTIDMDTFSSTLLPHLGTCFTEMHSPKKKSLLSRAFFNQVRGVIATNSLTAATLKKTFVLPAHRICVEPNGVSLERFSTQVSREEARSKLGLPLSGTWALYIGRFYEWKGLDILPAACKDLRTKNIECYIVGGTVKEFEDLVGEALPSNMHVMGVKSSTETPLWLAACDVALVLGTERNEDSFRFTSPMKLFEYMAARVPVVASDTPAVRDVLTSQDAFLYAHDNAPSLAENIAAAVSSRGVSAAHVEQAYLKVQQYSWRKRAERILEYMRTHA